MTNNNDKADTIKIALASTANAENFNAATHCQVITKSMVEALPSSVSVGELTEFLQENKGFLGGLRPNSDAETLNYLLQNLQTFPDSTPVRQVAATLVHEQRITDDKAKEIILTDFRDDGHVNLQQLPRAITVEQFSRLMRDEQFQAQIIAVATPAITEKDRNTYGYKVDKEYLNQLADSVSSRLGASVIQHIPIDGSTPVNEVAAVQADFTGNPKKCPDDSPPPPQFTTEPPRTAHSSRSSEFGFCTKDYVPSTVAGEEQTIKGKELKKLLEKASFAGKDLATDIALAENSLGEKGSITHHDTDKIKGISEGDFFTLAPSLQHKLTTKIESRIGQLGS